MLMQAVELMIVGMCAVFLFLTLLVFSITVMSKALNRLGIASPVVVGNEASSTSLPEQGSDLQKIVVVSAALEHHKRHIVSRED